MSSSPISAHKSISPFGAGVPVSPTIRLTFGRTLFSALNRFALCDLKEDSSSITTMSKSHLQKSTSHSTFSRLMTYTCASRSSAASRSFSGPSTFDSPIPDRCSHFSSSPPQVSLATRRGAITSTFRISK